MRNKLRVKSQVTCDTSPFQYPANRRGPRLADLQRPRAAQRPAASSSSCLTMMPRAGRDEAPMGGPGPHHRAHPRTRSPHTLRGRPWRREWWWWWCSGLVCECCPPAGRAGALCYRPTHEAACYPSVSITCVCVFRCSKHGRHRPCSMEGLSFSAYQPQPPAALAAPILTGRLVSRVRADSRYRPGPYPPRNS